MPPTMTASPTKPPPHRVLGGMFAHMQLNVYRLLGVMVARDGDLVGGKLDQAVISCFQKLADRKHKAGVRSICSFLTPTRVSLMQCRALDAIITILGPRAVPHVARYLRSFIDTHFPVTSFDEFPPCTLVSAVRLLTKHAPLEAAVLFPTLIEAAGFWRERQRFVDILREEHWMPSTDNGSALYFLHTGQYELIHTNSKEVLVAIADAFGNMPDEYFEHALEFFRAVIAECDLESLMDGRVTSMSADRLLALVERFPFQHFFLPHVERLIRECGWDTTQFQRALAYGMQHPTTSVFESLGYNCSRMRQHVRQFKGPQALPSVPDTVAFASRSFAQNTSIDVRARIHLLAVVNNDEACVELGNDLMPDVLDLAVNSRLSTDLYPFLVRVMQKYFAAHSTQAVRESLARRLSCTALAFLDVQYPPTAPISSQSISQILLKAYNETGDLLYAFCLSKTRGYESFIVGEAKRIFKNMKVLDGIAFRCSGDPALVPLFEAFASDAIDAKTCFVICKEVSGIKTSASVELLKRLLKLNVGRSEVIAAIGVIALPSGIDVLVDILRAMNGKVQHAPFGYARYVAVELNAARDALVNILAVAGDKCTKGQLELIGTLPDEIVYSTWRQSTADTGHDDEPQKVGEMVKVRLSDIKTTVSSLLTRLCVTKG